MYLAGRLIKFEVQDWLGRTPDHLRWYDKFVEHMSMEPIEDISRQVIDCYFQITKK